MTKEQIVKAVRQLESGAAVAILQRALEQAALLAPVGGLLGKSGTLVAQLEAEPAELFESPPFLESWRCAIDALQVEWTERRRWAQTLYAACGAGVAVLIGSVLAGASLALAVAGLGIAIASGASSLHRARDANRARADLQRLRATPLA